MPAKKIGWVPLREAPMDATAFGDTAKTYISGAESRSMTYTPARSAPPEGQYNELFITAAKPGSMVQAIFLDYVMLKGVTSMNIDLMPGEPPRLRLEMILGKVTYAEDDSEEK